jgi:opacity protein-like surface antigen
MHMSLFSRICTTAAFVLALAAPAAAQAPSQPATGGDEESMLLGLGLTFMNMSESTGVGFNANMLFNSLTENETGRLGVVGDLGFNRFSGATVTTVMGGLRYTFETNGRVLPYGQFLVGVMHCCDDTDFVPSIGAGLDVAWLENVNFRGELSFIFSDANAARFFLGVSLPIARR